MGVVLFALFQKIAIIFDLLAFFSLSLRGDTKYTRHIGGRKEPEKRGEPNGGGEKGASFERSDKIFSPRVTAPFLFIHTLQSLHIHSQKEEKRALPLPLFNPPTPAVSFFVLSYLILFNDRRRTRTKSPSTFNCQ